MTRVKTKQHAPGFDLGRATLSGMPLINRKPKSRAAVAEPTKEPIEPDDAPAQEPVQAAKPKPASLPTHDYDRDMS